MMERFMGWNAVFEREQQRDWTGFFDLAALGRGKCFGTVRPGIPEPVVRASGFAAALNEMAPVIESGEPLCGGRQWSLVKQLPAGVTEAEYASALAVDRARGQRDFIAGFDHTLPDYETLLAEGLDARLHRINRRMEKAETSGERATLEGFRICVEAVSDYLKRVMRKAETDGEPELAEALRHVSGSAPRTFYEALLFIWCLHCLLESEGRKHNALGRLDQLLYSFYIADTREGRLDSAAALNLLCHLWARIEGYDEITNICLGGQDATGSDAVNPLSFLMLEAARRVRTPSANLCARLHRGSPKSFVRACADLIREGFGFPAIYNDDTVLHALERVGIPAEAARGYCLVGCAEYTIPGRQPAWSDSRFNLLACVSKALHDFPESGPGAFQEYKERVFNRIRLGVAVHAEQISTQIRAFDPERFPDPVLSSLCAGCIEHARDINDGGTDFPRVHGIAGMGLGSAVDSLMAIRQLVFDKKRISWPRLRAALDANFKGHETQQRMLENQAPKYGNDDAETDQLAAEMTEAFNLACLRHRLPCSGYFAGALAANVSNIPAGKEIGATPDGRPAFSPVSDAASPFFGRDCKGPTAFLRSVAAPDYSLACGCTVINMRFEPSAFLEAEGLERLTSILRTIIRLNIPQMQFNVNSNGLLEAALRDPGRFQNLVVRVSGFSAYFTRLDSEVQRDIIRRRAHGAGAPA